LSNRDILYWSVDNKKTNSILEFIDNDIYTIVNITIDV